LDSGEPVHARTVVMAAGHRMHARTPEQLEGIARESDLVSHASEQPDLAQFRGRRVAVIGAGQSALETVALLHENGAEAILIARRAAVEWDTPPRGGETKLYRLRRPQSGLGRGWPKLLLETHADFVRPLPQPMRHKVLGAVLGPSGAYWLRERVEPYVEVRGDSQVVSAEVAHDRVLLQLATSTGESECIEVDHVIAATGYCYNLDRLDLLDPGLRDDIHTVGGFPHLSSHLESSVPGLYFTGLAAGGTFGPVMRFVCGTEFAGPRVAGSIARRRQRRSAAA
jgi:thioredoxin reductase